MYSTRVVYNIQIFVLCQMFSYIYNMVYYFTIPKLCNQIIVSSKNWQI